METPKHLLFIAPALSTFVTKDIDMLNKHYKVHVFLFKPKKKWLLPFTFLSQFFFLLRYLPVTTIYICKFPGYLSVLPTVFARLCGKPCLLITAGTESAALRSIRYGNYIKPLLSHATTFSFVNATHIAPVHRSLMKQTYSYEPSEINKEQGPLSFINNLKTPFTEIYYGFDPHKWVPGDQVRQLNSVLTIASGYDQPVVFKRKGIDLLFETAVLLPDYKFTVIGADSLSAFANVPPNVFLLKKMNQDQIKELMQTHEFYAQVSMFEGFPNALCEGMLCGCIPVASNVSAMPEIVGETGAILMHKNAVELAELLKKMGTWNKQSHSVMARQRIIAEFHMEAREKKLITLLQNLESGIK